MPEQEDGLLEGFQLWVNLPAAHKMDPPAYQEHAAAAIPVERRDGSVLVHVIAGRTAQGTAGPVIQPLTEPLYLDVELPPGTGFEEKLPADHNAFAYVVSGTLQAADGEGGGIRLGRDDLAVLSHGDRVALRAGADGGRLLLVSGRPLHEPVARGGPFVMNTQAEIRLAFSDYEAGRF
jgi:redox-sensitive bicupin YhaK (pirin superfamily)